MCADQASVRLTAVGFGLGPANSVLPTGGPPTLPLRLLMLPRPDRLPSPLLVTVTVAVWEVPTKVKPAVPPVMPSTGATPWPLRAVVTVCDRLLPLLLP